MSVTVLDTHARCSLPGGRPRVMPARLFVSNFHCRGVVSDLISVIGPSFVLRPEWVDVVGDSFVAVCSAGAVLPLSEKELRVGHKEPGILEKRAMTGVRIQNQLGVRNVLRKRERVDCTHHA